MTTRDSHISLLGRVIEVTPFAIVETILSVYEGRDAEAYARECQKLRARALDEEALWQDVCALLRLETQSDETIEEAEERWASGGAFLDETRAYWFQGADLMGFYDAHVRERLAQGIESTGIDMANASWWNRHPEAWEAAVESHNSF